MDCARLLPQGKDQVVAGNQNPGEAVMQLKKQFPINIREQIKRLLERNASNDRILSSLTLAWHSFLLDQKIDVLTVRGGNQFQTKLGHGLLYVFHSWSLRRALSMDTLPSWEATIPTRRCTRSQRAVRKPGNQ